MSINEAIKELLEHPDPRVRDLACEIDMETAEASCRASDALESLNAALEDGGK